MKSYTFLSVSAVALTVLGSCTTTPVPDTPIKPVTRLAMDLEGTYNRAISDAAEPLRDRRIRLSPLGAGEWIYYQVNEGADLENVYRQRVLQLQAGDNGTIAQVAYTLKTPEPFQALDAPLSALTLSDLDITLTEGCEMIWIEMPNGWAGRVDPGRCVIFSERRDTNMRIGSRADLIGNRLRQAESGYDMDGVRLWGSEDGEWLTLYRTID
jgi:hypothetical protein